MILLSCLYLGLIVSSSNCSFTHPLTLRPCAFVSRLLHLASHFSIPTVISCILLCSNPALTILYSNYRAIYERPTCPRTSLAPSLPVLLPFAHARASSRHISPHPSSFPFLRGQHHINWSPPQGVCSASSSLCHWRVFTVHSNSQNPFHTHCLTGSALCEPYLDVNHPRAARPSRLVPPEERSDTRLRSNS